MDSTFACPRDLQKNLFDGLSAMFGREVPLYDKSLAVNQHCNKAVCDVLSQLFVGFTRTESELFLTGRERHGAIRIGREDEFRWVARYLSCFDMEPHDFYDMTALGQKSQPVICTAFRSRSGPENRIFASLLRPEYFGEDIARRIASALQDRQVISPEVQSIIEKKERDGGLSLEDGNFLAQQGCEKIFCWTGLASNRDLYEDLCSSGYKIAADICCFPSHHLNHLTPNSLCIDLYSLAMKWKLGEKNDSIFTSESHKIISRLASRVDGHWMMLHFPELTHRSLQSYVRCEISPSAIEKVVADLRCSLHHDSLDLSALPHNGYKDRTEGPDEASPILLRQDSYRALTEHITFVDEPTPYESSHTARFGEIEQRFYATTSLGRSLYDSCLAQRDELQESDRNDSDPFENIPKDLEELVIEGLVYAEFEPKPGTNNQTPGETTMSVADLIRQGMLLFRGQRYEDFLPFSAAGIFASNLDQYGTESGSDSKVSYTKDYLESILGRSIVDSQAFYASVHQQSLQKSLESMGISSPLPLSVSPGH